MAYLAGIVDGEGTARVSQRTDGGLQGRLRIGNTNQNLLEHMSDWMGVTIVKTGRAGCVRPCEIDHVHKNHQSYHCTAVGLRAQIILENLLPYLLIKQYQAIPVIELPTNNYRGAPIRADLAARGWSITR